MKVRHINFAEGNGYWEEAKRRQAALLYVVRSAWSAWQAGDVEEVNRVHRHWYESTRRQCAPDSWVTRRLSLIREFLDSEDDLWLHRDSGRLWWLHGTAGVTEIDEVQHAEWQQIYPIVRLWKRGKGPWTNISANGTAVSFAALHPKARDRLSIMGTFATAQQDTADYFTALIAGGQLGTWHERPDWRRSAEEEGWIGSRAVPPINRRWLTALSRMRDNAFIRSDRSGDIEIRELKLREVRMNRAELELLIRSLLISQSYRCAYTGLSLVTDEENPAFMRASLDRIHLDGHYEAPNLHIVARFIQFMKGSTPDGEFRNYVELIRSSGAEHD